MDNIAPAHVDSPFHFSFPAPKKAFGALVNVSQATLGYGDTAVLKRVNVDLQPGTRIGLLGPNGAGKSTLINSLTGDLDLLAGIRVYGDNLKVGYFAQHQLEVLDLQASPVLHIQRLSPTATDQEVRNFLGGFDFHNDKALDAIADFSGGEKARLALALIVWQKPNLLLLDEPTNHLDLEMRHALTMALQSYEGALVVISHDRHLLKNTVDEFYLVADGEVKEFDGDLGDYQRWLKDFQRQISIPPTTCAAPVKDKKADRQKAAQQRQQLAPLTRQLRQLETAMEQHQRELDTVENSLSDESLYSDEKKGQLTQLLQRQADVKRKLQEVEEQWLQLQENLETRTNAQR